VLSNPCQGLAGVVEVWIAGFSEGVENRLFLNSGDFSLLLSFGGAKESRY